MWRSFSQGLIRVSSFVRSNNTSKYFKAFPLLNTIIVSPLFTKPVSTSFERAAYDAAPSGHGRIPSLDASFFIASIISWSLTAIAEPLVSLIALRISLSPKCFGTLIPEAIVAHLYSTQSLLLLFHMHLQ